MEKLWDVFVSLYVVCAATLRMSGMMLLGNEKVDCRIFVPAMLQHYRLSIAVGLSNIYGGRKSRRELFLTQENET